MNWKFWQNRDNGGVRAPRLKEIPEPVGRYVVVNLRKDPDWVWTLKGLVRPREGNRGCFDVRVVDERDALNRNIIITDYSFLDAHQELILFEGWYDKVNKKVIELKEKTLPPLPQAV